MYETQARKAFGDAQYEAQYKAQIDGVFAQMKAASSAKSASEVMAETGEKYKADLQKCARGEKPGPGSMVGPGACKKAKANAGPDGKLTDGSDGEAHRRRRGGGRRGRRWLDEPAQLTAGSRSGQSRVRRRHGAQGWRSSRRAARGRCPDPGAWSVRRA